MQTDYKNIFPDFLKGLRIIESNEIRYTGCCEYFHFGLTRSERNVIMVSIDLNYFKEPKKTDEPDKRALYYNYIKSLQEFEGFECNKYIGLYCINNTFFLVFESGPSINHALQFINNPLHKLLIFRDILKVFSYFYETGVYLPITSGEMFFVDFNYQFKYLYLGNVCNLLNSKESISIVDPKIWKVLQENFMKLTEFIQEHFKSSENISQKEIVSKFFIYQAMNIFKHGLFKHIDDFKDFPQGVRLYLLKLLKDHSFQTYLNDKEDITNYYLSLKDLLEESGLFLNYDKAPRVCLRTFTKEAEVMIVDQIIPVTRMKIPAGLPSEVSPVKATRVDKPHTIINNYIINANTYATNIIVPALNNRTKLEPKPEKVKEVNLTKEKNKSTLYLKAKFANFMKYYIPMDKKQEIDESNVIKPWRLPKLRPKRKVVDLTSEPDLQYPQLIWNPSKLFKDTVFHWLEHFRINWPRSNEIGYSPMIPLRILNEFNYDINAAINQVIPMNKLIDYINKYN
jgi:hypothetical protein